MTCALSRSSGVSECLAWKCAMQEETCSFKRRTWGAVTESCGEHNKQLVSNQVALCLCNHVALKEYDCFRQKTTHGPPVDSLHSRRNLDCRCCDARQFVLCWVGDMTQFAMRMACRAHAASPVHKTPPHVALDCWHFIRALNSRDANTR